MILRVGVPATGGGLLDAAARAGTPVLVSAGALWDSREKRFRAPCLPIWAHDAALDSAGFVAMKVHGGYPWTVEQYVELVVRGRLLAKIPRHHEPDAAALPSPWAWWSAMDYCCEPEIAADQAEVDRRIDLTVAGWVDCYEAAEAWRAEGVTDLVDPMPILQGWHADDYVRCARDLEAAIARTHRCRCAELGDDCGAEWHRSWDRLPPLVGIGSVCRRDLGGRAGLFAVLRALDAELPPGVRVHLFGVKGEALADLADHPRVASVDSMAWDFGARKRAGGEPNTVARRGAALEAWVSRQRGRAAPAQQRMNFRSPTR